jgi:hypothetical protein
MVARLLASEDVYAPAARAGRHVWVTGMTDRQVRVGGVGGQLDIGNAGTPGSAAGGLIVPPL